MATIRDIAAQAGVSVSTVSRFLNGQITVREATRLRIAKTVEELGYRPNYLARSLVLKQTQTLAVIIPDILNPYFAGLARGVEDTAQDANRSVVLCNSDNRIEKELSYLQLLHYKQVDGVVLVSSGTPVQQLRTIIEGGMTLVLGGRQIEGLAADAVFVDNAKGGYEATHHLARLGHRRIAMITGRTSIQTSRERQKGYAQALQEAGLPFEARYVVDGDFQWESGYQAMEQLLCTRPRPTAVFAANDLMALGAIRAVLDHGGQVPDDIAVVGFDDMPLASQVHPRLTTMAVSSYRVGCLACRLLLDRVVRKVDAPPRLVREEVHLVVRESCGAIPVLRGERGLPCSENGSSTGELGS